MLEKYFMFARGWHHLYTGIIMLGVGIYLNNWEHSYLWGTILTAIGTWLTIDDIGQHRLQRVYDNPDYHSYGHYIGKPLYQLRRWLIKKYGWEWLNKF